MLPQEGFKTVVAFGNVRASESMVSFNTTILDCSTSCLLTIDIFFGLEIRLLLVSFARPRTSVYLPVICFFRLYLFPCYLHLFEDGFV